MLVLLVALSCLSPVFTYSISEYERVALSNNVLLVLLISQGELSYLLSVQSRCERRQSLTNVFGVDSKVRMKVNGKVISAQRL